MTKQARDTFLQTGYVLMEGVLDPERDLQPVIDEYDSVVDRLALEWTQRGTVRDYDRDATVEAKMLHLMRATDGRCFQAMDITLPMEADIVADIPMHCGQAVFELLRNARLLDMIEIFIGSEIYSNPVQHMRIKPPEREISARSERHTLTLTGKTFWHQDLAVVTEEADQTALVGVWIPINEATVDNGCLVVVPESHKRGLIHHCDTETYQGVLEKLVGERRVPVPAKPGDVLFLHPLTLHGSTENVSTTARWSFDLRYNPVGQPTGRPWYPGFVARSRSRPETELRDHHLWAQSWDKARAELAGRPRPTFHRWSSNDPLCA